jgi:trk system potassium uptake protein TrkA
MNVIIVGGGKVGSHLAGILLQNGHSVRVVDDRPEIIERLHSELPEGTVVFGEMSSPATLEEAGIGKAGVLAAVTDKDDANLVITTLAKFEFRVPRVISRVNNPKNGWLFTPDMGVDVVISQADMMARLIAEEMSLGDMMTLMKLRKGAFSLVEEKIHPESEANGRAIRNLGLPEECILVAVIRKGDLILPRGDTILKESDEVLAVAHQSTLDVLASKLGKKKS